MITITVLKNPFNHNDKEIHVCEHVPGKTAYEYMQPYIMGLDEYVASINGEVVEDAKEQSVNSEDWIAVCPVVGKSGSDWFRAIFSIALSYYVGTWFKSGSFARFTGMSSSAAGGFWGHMIAGAITAIGGTLINHWFPAAKADRQTYETSPSYTWSNAHAPTGQGNALAVTYGTMRTAGQVIAQHVSSDGDNQYLNILLCGGEGPIDDISDIRINDNPLSYYKDVIVETRLGTNDQKVITNFNDNYADQSLAYELNSDDTWTKHQTNENAVEGLEITFEFPYGLYHIKDDGSLENASVTLQAQYRKVGDANWSDFKEGTSTDLVTTAASNNAFLRTYRIDHLTVAQYEVRVRCTAKSGTDIRYSTHVHWTQLSGMISGAYVDQTLDYELDTGNIWTKQQTEGKAVEGLEITAELPYGLFYANDKGGLSNASVTLEAQYRKVGDANWRNFTDGMSGSVTQNSRGNLTMISVNAAAPTETWTVTCVDYSTFSVSGSVSGVKPNAYIYQNYNNGLIAFNITEYGGEDRGFFPGDTFTIQVAPNSNLQITTAKNTAFLRTYRIDGLPAAQYEARVRCTAKSGTNNRYSTRVYWTQLSSIMYDDFARPGKVLIGIKALATNQLSGGLPSITWLQTRNTVWVRNAVTNQYEQKSATNPAWAAYDMIHRCRRLKNVNTGEYEFVVQGAPRSRAVYQDFVNWAAFCDGRNLTFNYIFNTATDLWASLEKPEGVGRGKVIMRGTKFGCVCDAPGEPVQLFTVGNIITDKFKEIFVSQKDRANAIEITFTNKDKAYEKDIITVYADDYDSASEPNITQITLEGATTRDQANREGKYRLRLNQYLQRTVEHSADIDAIACQISDIVLLAHDVPQWGYSGRLLGATATTLQLDRQVTLKPGKSYAIAVQVTNPVATTAQDAQSIETVSVKDVTQETTTDTVILTSSLSSVPLKWDLYSFGETSKVVKPFRVLNISRDQDMRRKITCLEYIKEIYEKEAEDEDIPEINYSALDVSPAEVTRVSAAEETYRQKDGTIVSNLNVSWMIPRNKLIVGYEVSYSIDNGTTWTEWTTGVKALSTTIVGVKTNTTYLVKVCTINSVGQVSLGVKSAPVLIIGKDVPPSDVAQITATIDPSNCTKIHLSWSAVDDIDLSGYRLSESGNVITATPITDTQYVYTAGASRQYNFSVVAVDNSGNLSEVPATTTIPITVEPATVTGFTAVQLDTDRSRLRMIWQANSESDISHYEIRQGTDWNTASVIATQLKATMFEYTLSVEGSQTFMIKVLNVAGKSSVAAAIVTKQITLKPNAPASGIITQAIQDKSILTISWSAITDIDLQNYEVRQGTDWNSGIRVTTTKETSCQYKIANSGVYNFMVRSSNIAGYLSAILNLSILANLSPSNVTGFSIAASMADRRILNCQWNAVTDSDLLEYEIRQGTNWDTATPVATHIKGNFCSIQFAGGNATFLLKAVNASGYYSDVAASYAVVVSAVPNTPGAGSILSDPQNKLKLIISWEAVFDTDLLDYEVRMGSTWATAALVTNTKEKTCMYTVETGGEYTFLVAAKTIGNQYSSPRTLAVNVAKEPSDVTTFTVVSNPLDRRVLTASWVEISDTDLLGYEIRQGSNWDTATVITSRLRASSYSFQFAGGSATFLLKAMNVSNNYSVNPASQSVDIASIPSTPGAGAVSPDPQDRMVLSISWGAVTDTDIQGYEVRLGTTWSSAALLTITKETKCQYTAESGGTLTFLVASKTVGGEYSTPRTISAVLNQEPSDVIIFTAAQSVLDKRIVNLAWSGITDSDLLGYEIRKGTIWDTATVITSNLREINFQYTAEVEGTATFLIKAKTVAGKYSLNAKSAALQVTLSPSKPGAGSITQDVNNSVVQVLSWGAVTDADLLHYEIRQGSTFSGGAFIATTKETSYRYTTADNTPLSFWIAAKSIGNWYSQAVQLTGTPYVNPEDVTGFVASQLVQDLSKVRLSWHAVSNKDFSYYEIREGANWDHSSVVVTRIAGLFFEATITEEREYTYWIKAFNFAGKGSLSPASTGGTFNMNPTMPSGLNVVTDDSDKTKLNISWNPIGNQDLKEYELRVGVTWDDADVVVISKTKETKSVWYPSSSQTYHFMLVARNNTNWLSDVAEVSHTAYIEPANVTGFHAMQNGSNSLMAWDKVSEPDVVGYEIREGSSFDNGALITTGINTLTYQAPVDTEKTYRYWIKAINRAGKYSQNAMSAEVTITGLPPRNVVEEFDEITLQNGTHSNTEFGPSAINFSNMGGRFSDYPNTKFSDVGGQTVLKLKNVSLIKNGNFTSGNADPARWLPIAGSGQSIIGGVYRLTAATTGTRGVYYDFPETLDRNVVYVVEFEARANKSMSLTDGFTTQAGAYAGAGATPTAVGLSLTTSWQTFKREVTITSTGTEPGRYLFHYGSYTAGDWTEIKWARIYKKTDEGLFLVGQWGGGFSASGEYLVERKNLGQLITANISSQFVSTNLLTAGVNAKLQFRTSSDGINFTDWADFQPVQTTFQHIDFKVVLNTADPGQTPEVNIFKEIIDVPDIDKAGTSTIAVGGYTVNYGYTFYDYPAVVPTAIGAGLRAELQSVSKSNFVVKVLNTAGQDVGGQITWIAKGY